MLLFKTLEFSELQSEYKWSNIKILKKDYQEQRIKTCNWPKIDKNMHQMLCQYHSDTYMKHFDFRKLVITLI